MFEKSFTKVANAVAYACGLPLTFMGCVLVVVVWGVSGPVFGFSDTWQLIINTGTTIVTFLMVFLIQNTQNRDGAAVQAKLDELIRVSAGQNHFIGIEHLTESEVDAFRKRCEQAAKLHESLHGDEVVLETEQEARRTPASSEQLTDLEPHSMLGANGRSP